MDPRKQRILDLTKLLKEDYDLLTKLDAANRVEDVPVRKARLERDIENLETQIKKHEAQLNSLIIAVQNYPLDIVDEVLDKPDEVVEDPPDIETILGTPVDLLVSAFQYHTEIKKKQSELSKISNWFNVGNEVGSDQCTYATTFLNTLREIVQPFSESLDEHTSPEPRVDIVQFRYSLITPLHLSVKLLHDLVRLIPAFSNSLKSSRDRLMRQEEICKDLNAVEESLREIHVHMALYKTLLNFDLPKLKSLYLKLGITYKDVQADSPEMKISKLIEYCKRNNNYYEQLIREVQVEHSNRLTNKSNISYGTSSA